MCNLSSCYQQFWWWVEFICNVWYLVDYKWTLGLKFLRILLHNVEQVLKYPKHEGTEVHVWPIWRLQNTTEYVSVILGPMGDLRMLGGSRLTSQMAIVYVVLSMCPLPRTMNLPGHTPKWSFYFGCETLRWSVLSTVFLVLSDSLLKKNSTGKLVYYWYPLIFA